ncbi:MAG: sensor histidine kinase [Firmicutes bacterium]|nr:sensor histidine kinase [Bacillota bacterium]
MSAERSFGLQWRLAAICLAAGATGALVSLISYVATVYLGLQSQVAIIIALLSGILVGFLAAIAGSLITRSVKLRLWEAGRMAGSIARGDYQARLDKGPEDEVGWLEEQLNLMAVQLEEAIGALKTLAERNRLLSEEAGRGAALEERMRLARDLHDTVNQQLFVLVLRAAALRKKIKDNVDNSEALVEESETLELIARQAHSQIRELIMQIRPISLEREGLGKALQEYATNLAEREGWKLVDQIDLTVGLTGEQGEGLFRIAQEALNNISKHAQADQVNIRLLQQGDSVQMQVHDNGKGFEPRARVNITAVGLSGIRERAAAIGAQVIVDSVFGRGTKLTVKLSLAGEGSD